MTKADVTFLQHMCTRESRPLVAPLTRLHRRKGNGCSKGGTPCAGVEETSVTCAILNMVSSMEGVVRNSLKVEYLHNHCTDSSKPYIEMKLVIVPTKYILLFGRCMRP